jgi:hypothetical protein
MRGCLLSINLKNLLLFMCFLINTSGNAILCARFIECCRQKSELGVCLSVACGDARGAIEEVMTPKKIQNVTA